MCGRYRLSRRKQVIEEYFGSAPWDDDWKASMLEHLIAMSSGQMKSWF